MKKASDAPQPFKGEKPIFGCRRPERRDAVEHRRRILEVARRLFAERSVEAVSMHQIALAAGVGQGTLYRRYANKGELCMDLLQERHESFVAEITAVLAEPANSGALERLDGVISHFVFLLEEQGTMLCPIVISEMHELLMNEGPEHSPQRNPFYVWIHSLLAGLLREAIERNEIVELDVVYTADAILAVLHPMLYRFQREERGFSAEQIIQGLRRIYIQGMR
jgi:AcrR family transcriptional regulator